MSTAFGLAMYCHTSYQHPWRTATQTIDHSSIDISVIRDTQRYWSFVEDLRHDEIRGWWWWWWHIFHYDCIKFCTVFLQQHHCKQYSTGLIMTIIMIIMTVCQLCHAITFYFTIKEKINRTSVRQEQLRSIEHQLTLLSTTRLSQRNWFIIRCGMLTPRLDSKLHTQLLLHTLRVITSLMPESQPNAHHNLRARFLLCMYIPNLHKNKFMNLEKLKFSGSVMLTSPINKL